MSNILLAAWNCPKCDAVNYGLPYCTKCDWYDEKFNEWSKGRLKRSQKLHKSLIASHDKEVET